METLNSLFKELYEAKQQEDIFKAKRTALEEQIALTWGIPQEWEGSHMEKTDEFKVKISRRMNLKIDADALTDIAHKHDLGSFLGTLFKWKPELDKKQWDKADENIKAAFAESMTKTPGKVSVSVEKIDKEAA